MTPDELEEALQEVEKDDPRRTIAAELAALRARIAELEAPRTCATCKFLAGTKICERIGLWRLPETHDTFGCIHHRPAGAK